MLQKEKEKDTTNTKNHKYATQPPEKIGQSKKKTQSIDNITEQQQTIRKTSGRQQP